MNPFLFLWISIVMFLVMFLGGAINYPSVSRELGHKAALYQLIAYSCRAIGFALVILCIIRFSSHQLAAQTYAALVILLAIPLWVYIGIYPERKRQAGVLILNLGQAPLIEQLGLILCSVFSAFYGLALIFINFDSFLISDYPRLLRYSFSFLSLSGTVFYILVSVSRRELRENGILFFPNFIRWEEILSYRWEGRRGNFLKLHLRRFSPFAGRISLSIPIIHKNAVNNILNVRLSSKKINI